MRRKGNRGAITLFTLIAGLSFIAFLTTMLMMISIKRQTQAEATKQTKDIYSSGDASNIYDEYFAEGAVPIYTFEQLKKMCSGDTIAINEMDGKYYTFSNDAVYVLMNDIVGEYNGTIDLPSPALAENGRIVGNGKLIKILNSSTGDYDLYKGDDKHILPVVARVGNNYYVSLQEAFNATSSSNGITVWLLRDISDNVTVGSDKNISLKLEGHTITNEDDEPVITVNGFLMTNDGRIEGHFESDVPTIRVNPNAEIDISSTNISRTSEYEYKKETVELHGTFKIDSGKIENTDQCAIWSYTDSDVTMEISGTAELYSSATEYVTLYNNTTGNTKITGGTIIAENSFAIRQEGIMEITGGEITGAHGGGVGNVSGLLKISGGRIRATNSNAITHKTDGTLEISGTAEIEGTSSNVPILTNRGTATITGGTISATNSNTIYNYAEGILEIGGTAEIEGISTNNPTLYNYGTATITGGNVISNNNIGIYVSGILNVSGDLTNITGKSYGIYAYSRSNNNNGRKYNIDRWIRYILFQHS